MYEIERLYYLYSILSGYGRSRGRGGRRSGRSGWQDRGRGGGGRYYDRPSRRYWDRSRSRSHSKSRSRTPDERQKDRSRSHSKSGNDRDRNLRPEDPKQRSVERGSNTSVGQPMDAERRLHRSRWENEPEEAEGNEESGPATDTVFETSDFQAAIQVKTLTALRYIYYNDSVEIINMRCSIGRKIPLTHYSAKFCHYKEYTRLSFYIWAPKSFLPT